MTDKWPREAFVLAVWASDLKPLARLVALCFAEHAGSNEYAWVTYPRLRECTGLSRDALGRAIKELRKHKWLVLKEPARQQRAPRYWLRIPEPQQSASPTAEDLQASGRRMPGPSSGTPDGLLDGSSSPSPDTSSPSHDTSSPSGRGDQSSDNSTDRSIDAREAGGLAAVPTEQRRAVTEVLARLEPAVTEVDVIDCVAWIADTIAPDNLSGYVSRFSASDVAARAEQQRDRGSAKSSAVGKCPHGKINGQEIIGLGVHAGRRCDQCEQADPAVVDPWQPSPPRPSGDGQAAATRVQQHLELARQFAAAETARCEESA